MKDIVIAGLLDLIEKRKMNQKEKKKAISTAIRM